MKNSAHVYSAKEYEGFRTSNEILMAIEQITMDDLLKPNSTAYQAWADPEPHQYHEIYVRAWELADKDTDELFWGESGAISRPHWRITK